MVRAVAFYGASDDLIEVEDADGTLAEEYSTSSGSWTGLLEDVESGDTAYVYVTYQDSGCWTATIGLYEEEYTLPKWNPRISLQHKYATGLVLDLPEGVTLKEIEE